VEYNKYKITELIEKNYVFASVLYYFGIEFYEYSEQTLEQVCLERGLSMQSVINSLESATHQDDLPNLSSLPVEIIIEYLRHSHYLFVKHKLPYIARLIQSLKKEEAKSTPVAEDLKFVFPLYVEDFIQHIYQEEDTLFTYILQLNHALNGRFHPGKLFYMMENYSVERFAIEHDCHDDEMQGIRNITNDYRIEPATSLLVKVVYKELQSFEESLITHAKVENEILFPKALMLEKEVKKIWRSKINLN
jgi:regulator of cell morphogenesis and NO signaling